MHRFPERDDLLSGIYGEILLEILINIDKFFSLFVNNLAGRLWPLDLLLKGIANDYFLVVISFLGLLVLWFGNLERDQRVVNQRLALQAMASFGLSSAAVSIINMFFYRPRPFADIAVTTLLYQPTDSSFPSNSAAVLFGLAFAVWLGNRKAGKVFLLIAVVHSTARVIAGMHYPLDIVGGAAVGFLMALFVRWLFNVLRPLVNLMMTMARAFFMA